MTTLKKGTNPYFELPLAFDPKKYYGWQDKVHSVLSMVSGPSPQSVQFLGLPGMGKTTLLRYLADRNGALSQEKHRAELQPPFDKNPHLLFLLLVQFRLRPAGTHTFVYLYECLLEAYPQYQQYVREHCDARGLPIPALPDLGPSVLNPSLAVDAFDRAVTQCPEVRFVLLLDDFDLAFKDLKLFEVSQLRPWVRNVAFVVIAERRLDLMNAEAAGSSFIQQLPIVRLGGLSNDEARRLIEEPARIAKKPFHPKDVEFILEYAYGHPYLLILAGSTLWSLRELFQQTDLTQALCDEHGNALVGHLEVEFRATFQLYWSYLENSEQIALASLVNQHSGMGEDQHALASLTNRGLVVYDPAIKSHRPFSRLFYNFLSAMSEPSSSTATLELTPLEQNLYQYLQRHSNQLCAFDQLLQEIWNYSDQEPGDDRDKRKRMQVTISRLRSKLKRANTGEDIVGIRDQGYRFIRSTVEGRQHR